MIKYQKITDISLVTDTISKNPYLKSRYDTNTDIFSSAIHRRYFRCIDPPLSVCCCHWQTTTSWAQASHLTWVQSWRLVYFITLTIKSLLCVHLRSRRLLETFLFGQWSHGAVWTVFNRSKKLSRKTGPLWLVYHNFTNSQHLLILFVWIVLIHFLMYCVKSF